MEKSTDKPSPQRRIFVVVALLILLVGFPLGSWYYLKGGVEWRKEALAELRDYGKIRAVHMVFPGNDRINRVGEKVCVIHNFGENPDLTEENRFILNTGQRLFEQFGENPYFRFVVIKRQGTAAFKSHIQTLPSIDYATWVQHGALGSWSTILNNGYDKFCKDEGIRPTDQFYALCDTTGTIRRFYNALDDKEIGRMVEHIAILLPPPE
jgi:hypothetical protein